VGHLPVSFVLLELFIPTQMGRQGTVYNVGSYMESCMINYTITYNSILLHIVANKHMDLHFCEAIR